MSDIAIEVKNVDKVYKLYENPIDRLKESLSLNGKSYHKEHYALKDISMKVKKGETIGIIGTNGSGKSTLLKILTGVLSKTTGEVNINGKISALLELGAGFNMEYTGIENIYLNGTISGYSREEMDRKIEGILKFADIGEFVHQPVKTYSSGMFVRLAFAVAINIDPDILIVDEALSVGDNIFQAKCYKKFEELRERGTTILLVTHDIDSVRRFCERCIWLDKGIIREEGDVEKVTGHYMSYTSKRTKSVESKKRIKDKECKKVDEYQREFKAIARWGSSVGAIKDVRLENKKGEEVEYIDKNQDIKISIRINISDGLENLDKLGLAFSIKNTKGQDLIVGSTFENEDYEFNEGYHLVKFQMRNCLVPGEYYLVASLETRNMAVPEYVDYIDGACYFKVGSEKIYYGMLDIPIDVEII